MPRKTFVAGDVLTASDMNTFLMDQSVMTFADSAARGSAIPSPTEGMVTYLDDTDAFEYWDGSAFTPLASSSGAATNAIINGAFDIWQRGTASTFSGAGGFTADRFNFDSGTGGTVIVTQATFAPGEELVPGFGARFYANLNFTASGTGAADQGQRIEDVRTFAAQTITVSVYAKVSTGTHVVTPQVVQRFGSGGSSDVITDGATWTLTTDWQRFSSTISVPSITGKTIGAGSSCQVRMNLATTGVKEYQLWGFQVEAGSTATPFRRNANSLAGELAACQRYYERITATAAFGSFLSLGIAISTTQGRVPVQFMVPKRAAPTSVEFGGTLAFSDGVSPNLLTLITLDNPNPTHTRLGITSSGLSQYRPYYINANNDTTAFIGFSSEL